MSTSKTRIWFIPTSPRSPGKIRNELTLLSKFDKLDWWEKDSSGKNINQLKFGKLLEDSDFYEGSISEAYPDFAARDRLRAPQMFGFAYIDEGGILHITPAGWQLIKGERIETLFLKQALKLQFPSWQHGGNPRTLSRYLVDQMNIFPFVEALRIVSDVGGVTKEELAIFILPILSKDNVSIAIEKFLKFKKEKNRVRAGRERSEFIYDFFKKTFYEVYKEDIDAGNIDTRQITTSTIEEFVRKKMRNARDYADACFRYFQYTGLYSRTDEKLVISTTRQMQIKRILSEMEFSILPYENVTEFYSEFGNPDLPVLPWENIKDLKSEIGNTLSSIGKARQKIKTQLPSIKLPTIKPAPAPTLNNLTEYSYELRMQLRSTNEQVLSLDLATPSGLQQLIDTYERVVRKEVVEPPLFMEWNTWRAFLALDKFRSLKPNLELDDSLMPISTAGGRKADLEVYYYSDFTVLIEVTLTYGERQYDTEAEPVTRHVARFQEKEAKQSDRKVFGLFIAPKIHPNTVNYFNLYLRHDLIPEAGRLAIIPLPLQEFIDFVSFCINNNDAFTENSFRNLLDQLEAVGKSLPDGQAIKWSGQITHSLTEWKRLRLQELALAKK